MVYNTIYMDQMSKIVSLCKRRGFVYPGSEIYGGLANTWDYGPLGAEVLRNIKNLWWKKFVTDREDIFGIETGILMNPKVWEASGHTESFSDALIDCRECKNRTRADHLIEDKLKNIKVEGKSLTNLDELIAENKINCPVCGKFNWTKARQFNLLFETHIGIVPENQSKVYLRGETAQGMFVNFKNILLSFSPKLPFGIAQIGKAFRNEITKGNFIFRTLEFEQMEIEYFVKENTWKKYFESWKKEMWTWTQLLGIPTSKLRWRPHTEDEISHYSTRTEDIEYNFPFGGYKELYGLAYRTNYDLKTHAKHSGEDLEYTDPESGKKFIPHVIEPTFGLNRSLVPVLLEAYLEEGKRVVLKLPPKLAPYKAAVFPLVSNKPELVEKARQIFNKLKSKFSSVWDERGNIGKRYFSQDEIGTPWCITIDYDTLKNDTVTVRDRDTKGQVRLRNEKLFNYIEDKLK